MFFGLSDSITGGWVLQHKDLANILPVATNQVVILGQI